jgi:hypothetical protein
MEYRRHLRLAALNMPCTLVQALQMYQKLLPGALGALGGSLQHLHTASWPTRSSIQCAHVHSKANLLQQRFDYKPRPVAVDRLPCLACSVLVILALAACTARNPDSDIACGPWHSI